MMKLDNGTRGSLFLSMKEASGSIAGCKWALGDERTVMEASRGTWT
jgi:hypothetical protein